MTVHWNDVLFKWKTLPFNLKCSVILWMTIALALIGNNLDLWGSNSFILGLAYLAGVFFMVYVYLLRFLAEQVSGIISLPLSTILKDEQHWKAYRATFFVMSIIIYSGWSFKPLLSPLPFWVQLALYIVWLGLIFLFSIKSLHDPVSYLATIPVKSESKFSEINDTVNYLAIAFVVVVFAMILLIYYDI